MFRPEKSVTILPLESALILAEEAVSYARSKAPKGGSQIENNDLDYRYFQSLRVGVGTQSEKPDKAQLGIRDIVRQFYIENGPLIPDPKLHVRSVYHDEYQIFVGKLSGTGLPCFRLFSPIPIKYACGAYLY